MKWLERNDILTRGKMATLVRRGYPAQIALHEALRECHIEWRSPALQPMLETPEASRRRPRSPEPSGEIPAAPTKWARALKADSHKTVSMIKGGARLCKPWNDGRGCKDPVQSFAPVRCEASFWSSLLVQATHSFGAWVGTSPPGGYHLGGTTNHPITSPRLLWRRCTVSHRRLQLRARQLQHRVLSCMVPSLSLGEGGETCLNPRGLRALEDAGWWWICGRGLVDCPRHFTMRLALLLLVSRMGCWGHEGGKANYARHCAHRPSGNGHGRRTNSMDSPSPTPRHLDGWWEPMSG